MRWIIVALIVAALGALLVKHIRQSRVMDEDGGVHDPPRPRDDGGPRHPVP